MLLRQRTQSVGSSAGRAEGLASYNAPQWGQKNFPPALAVHLWAMPHLPEVHPPALLAIMYYVYQSATFVNRAESDRARVAEPKRGQSDKQRKTSSLGHENRKRGPVGRRGKCPGEPEAPRSRSAVRAAHGLRHRERRVGAVEKLDCGEHELALADVLEIVHLELLR
jgi:hypothetical protein